MSSVRVDKEDNIFITGYTSASFFENSHYGGNDVILVKMTDAGDIIWAKQWGTAQRVRRKKKHLSYKKK